VKTDPWATLGMPAPVVAERIGWPYSMTPLNKRLGWIRPEYVGIDPVDRVTYEPGEIAQCDQGSRRRESRSRPHRSGCCRCW
jgi:hypothetical protein